MHDDFAQFANSPLGSEVTAPDPECDGLYVSGFIAAVDAAKRTVTLNRAGKSPVVLQFPILEPQPRTAADAPEDEK